MVSPLMHLLWVEELERDRRRRRPLPPEPAATPTEPVTLRLETVHDAEAIEQLRVVSGGRRPRWGRHVVAEVDGAIVAALPLAGGAAMRDPFRRTAHLLPLLELRARQVTDPPPERRRRGLLRWADSRLP
jgi:hypothetical protein